MLPQGYDHQCGLEGMGKRKREFCISHGTGRFGVFGVGASEGSTAGPPRCTFAAGIASRRAITPPVASGRHAKRGLQSPVGGVAERRACSVFAFRSVAC
ncbi:hypothetical protein MRB53_040293 [Persea americana]|nr:hypothetical protein MRB53_040293 [Persea americana]